MKHLHSLLMGVMATLWIAGCAKPPPLVPAGRGLMPAQNATTDPWTPSYATLVQRYNARTADLSQLWSRAKVKVQWRDDQDKVRKEDGDGNLIFRRPRDLALTVGKLGNVGLWIGSNSEHYWLMDLQGDGAAYIGQHRFVGQPCAKPLPLAISPGDLLLVLGVAPIDPSLAPDPPAVEMIDGYALIEPPGLGARLLLDPATSRPVRIDLLDDQGRSSIVCQLSHEQHLSPTTAMPTRFHLYLLHGQTKLTVQLTHLRTDKKIKARAFDLPFLLNAHKPEQHISLDRDCAR